MAANYTSNPIAVQSPDTGMRGLHLPVISIPAGTDAPTIESITQEMKVNTDSVGYVASAIPTWWRETLAFHTSASTFTTNQAPFPNYGSLSLLVSGTGPTITFQDPSTVGSPIYSGRTCALTPGTAAAAYAWLTSPQKIAGFASPASLYIAVECDLMFANAAGTNAQFYMGFGDAQNLLAATNFVYATRTSSVWNLTNQTTSLGAANTPTNSVFQKVKLVCYGASTPEGIAAGSAQSVLYINGVVAATVNSVAGATNCYFSVGGTATGVSAPIVTIGNWAMCWNRY